MTTTGGELARRWRPRRPRRKQLLLSAVAMLLAAVGLAALTDPLGGSGGASGVPDNGTATSLAKVERRSLSSQILVDGTLGYRGASSIVVPAGTSQADVRAAQQAVASTQAALQAAGATLSADERALGQARAKLAADRLKQASDCQGDGAAGGGTGDGSNGSDSGSGADPCSSDAQTVATDEETVGAAEQKVASDRGAVATARAALAGAEQSLAAAESSATGHEATAAYTMLPSPGQVVQRGEALYAVDGQPVLLLYGRVPAWRAFRPGMSPGRDVAQLNANLRALGHGGGLSGDRFTDATERAILALQAEHGLTQTGALTLGSVVFKPGPVRIATVTPTLGQAVQPGPVLSVTSTRHHVSIELDAGEQTEVEVGDTVTITLPSGRTTTGRVSFVGSVASTPSSGGASDSSTPTIDVDVRLLRQADAGRLDQAPVSVAITTDSVRGVLVAPVNALLALAGGGYGVEVVDGGGVHRLVAVSLGLFDDAEGLVEVSGSGLRAGQRVVVPTS